MAEPGNDGYNQPMPTHSKQQPLGRRLPDVRIKPPGPESRRLASELARYESPGVSTMAGGLMPIVWREARGANVVDADGNVYIDLTGGFGVANLGHANPKVVGAVARQAKRLLHALGDVHPSDVRVELARRLAELAPVDDAQVILCSTGAEAVEVALKTATRFTGKHGFLAFEGGFHGQTYGALSVTHRREFRDPFETQIFQGVARVPYAYCYRCSLGKTYPTCEVACLGPVEAALRSPPAWAGEIAAVIIEPVQGREGEIVPPPEYLPRLRE
ncbi:MAG: aminotransferase class III-fold pyridoxal phosphate-dependent enzyme, partial [Chloroflexi bacterium]|nr:aminotransferase class III-fold pyridoxal phosphate-dependent enzyme [Chloroflexota bacterium]